MTRIDSLQVSNRDDSDLPKVDDSVLDEAGVDALFALIAREGEAVQVLLKGDVQTRAEVSGDDLTEARERLRAGVVYGVQIRYRLGGVAWLDTLMHVAGGVRRVRIEQQ